MGGTAKSLVFGNLWMLVKPILPPERPRPKVGRLLIPNRTALAGIPFALKSGILREMRPLGDGLQNKDHLGRRRWVVTSASSWFSRFAG